MDTSNPSPTDCSDSEASADWKKDWENFISNMYRPWRKDILIQNYKAIKLGYHAFQDSTAFSNWIEGREYPYQNIYVEIGWNLRKEKNVAPILTPG